MIEDNIPQILVTGPELVVVNVEIPEKLFANAAGFLRRDGAKYGAARASPPY